MRGFKTTQALVWNSLLVGIYIHNRYIDAIKERKEERKKQQKRVESYSISHPSSFYAFLCSLLSTLLRAVLITHTYIDTFSMDLRCTYMHHHTMLLADVRVVLRFLSFCDYVLHTCVYKKHAQPPPCQSLCAPPLPGLQYDIRGSGVGDS